jgi:hypothetical protein
MLQLGGDFDFAEESVATQGHRDLRAEHLDRYLAAVPEVIGQEHRCHAPLAQLPLDLITVGECGGEGVDDVHVQAVNGRWAVVACGFADLPVRG